MSSEKSIEIEKLDKEINNIYNDISTLNQMKREHEDIFEKDYNKISKILNSGLFKDEQESSALQEMMHGISKKNVDFDYAVEEASSVYNKRIEELEQKKLEMEEKENAERS